jgi:hypothetical protein
MSHSRGGRIKISTSFLAEYKAKEKKREKESKREGVLAKTTETPARQVKPVR